MNNLFNINLKYKRKYLKKQYVDIFKQEILTYLLENIPYLKLNIENILYIGEETESIVNNAIKHENSSLENIPITYMSIQDYHNKKINETYSLIIVNMSLHYEENLQTTLKQMSGNLISNGCILISFPLDGILEPFKNTFIQLELSMFNKISPRFIPLPDIKDLGNLMHQCGFIDVMTYSLEIDAMYKSLQSILKDLRNFNENNIFIKQESYSLNKKFYNELEKRMNMLKEEKHIPISIKFANVIAWKR